MDMVLLYLQLRPLCTARVKSAFGLADCMNVFSESGPPFPLMTTLFEHCHYCLCSLADYLNSRYRSCRRYGSKDRQ